MNGNNTKYFTEQLGIFCPLNQLQNHQLSYKKISLSSLSLSLHPHIFNIQTISMLWKYHYTSSSAIKKISINGIRDIRMCFFLLFHYFCSDIHTKAVIGLIKCHCTVTLSTGSGWPLHQQQTTDCEGRDAASAMSSASQSACS